jgi:hypothetical protein
MNISRLVLAPVIHQLHMVVGHQFHEPVEGVVERPDVREDVAEPDVRAADALRVDVDRDRQFRHL